MAYRRPAIEVIQEFQQAAAALALPSLPACVIGPAFQVVDEELVGIYDESNLSISSYPYTGLAGGAIVDLTEPPEGEKDSNVHKAVEVTLKELYLVKVPELPETTRTTGAGIGLADPNLFQDDTTGAFASFDPDADGAPTFYVEIIGSANAIDAADLGRKLVTGKTDDNELILAVEWATALPLGDVEYRVLEFRDEEKYASDDLSNEGIAKDADSVDINPGLATVSDATPLAVAEADVYLSWRALRPDLAGILSPFTDLDSLEAVFGIGAVVPSNIGPYGVNLAQLNTTTEVNFVGLDNGYFTNEEQAYQGAFEFLESRDVYGLAALTHLTAVHQSLKSHIEGMSQSTVGRERVGFVSRELVEEETLIPASGIGSVTSEGTLNGTSGTANKTFKDPTNGSYVSDAVVVGAFLEISAYAAVEGVDRALSPDEQDWFSVGPDVVQMQNGGFIGTDIGKFIILRGATSLTNDIPFAISSITSTEQVVVGTTPTQEVMEATTRAWITSLSRAITADDGVDNVDAGTKIWTFTNGAFTSADIGRILFVGGATAPGDNGAFIINSVISPTAVTTIETPGANETFNGVAYSIYDIDREPARDAVSDSVDATSREWTFNKAVFTDDDIGRKLRVAGATNAENNDDHIIESVISPTIVRTDNSTAPLADETFDGLNTPTLSTLDIVSVTPSAAEAAFITGTRHAISAIISESQMSLDADPTGGFGGTIEDVVYIVTRDLSLNEQADLLAGYATSLGSRRVVSMQPDTLAVSINGLATKIPGYFGGPVLSGMTAGLPSQAGFTNLSVTGFVGRENSDDKFSDTQLDTIAGGGNMIFTQPVPGAALEVRHQLTTDVSTIYFQEFSVTKNVDLISRFFRGLYRPFLGIYNITDGLLDLLKTRGSGGIEFLKEQRAPRIGAPLRNGQLKRIEESSNQPDTVEIDIDVSIPLPLNNIKLTILV
jgi:hypothetical protein